MEPWTSKTNIFPDVETCDAPIQVLEGNTTTSEDVEEYSVHDSDDESQDNEQSEGGNLYDSSNPPRGSFPSFKEAWDKIGH